LTTQNHVEEDEFEILEVELEDGTVEPFVIVHEFKIEEKAFLVVVPEATVARVMEGDAAEETELEYDVLQEGADGETYGQPDERYTLMAMAEARRFWDSED